MIINTKNQEQFISPTTIDSEDLTSLKTLRSSQNIFRLLQLPKSLEEAFRVHYRSESTTIVRYSVYGLIALYLLVVLPVGLLIHDSMRDLWLDTAVYPIGVALIIIWLCTKIPQLSSFTELSLRFGVFLSLAGTIYGFLILGNTLLGLVAGCETIYVLMVAFSLLMLRILAALASAIAAFAIALTAAKLANIEIIWINTFLYFWVPLLISAVTGYLLEHAARRDFVQRLMHQQDKLQMVNDLAIMVNDVDDMDTVLSLALARICSHTGWIAGRVSTVDDAHQQTSAHYETPKLIDDTLSAIEQLWLSPLPLWAKQVVDAGSAQWRTYEINSNHTISLKHSPKMHLIFPVKLDNRTLAVLEFFSMQYEQPDERLLSLMENIGYQLGRVFERQLQLQDMKVKALHDVLTGLPNRAYLFDCLRTEIARSQRDPNYGFCVLFLDMDRFKWVNDSLGHLSGDRLLVELSRRLQQGVRATDFAARLGGDEFAILITSTRDKSQAIAAVERIKKQLEKPFTMAGHTIHISLSIGVALSAAHYIEPEELLRDADIAMYHAKQQGHGTFTIFTDEMREQAIGQLKMVVELRQAIQDQQLTLHYQPIVRMDSGVVIGFESLIRWHHPDRGMISPAQFIPLAEETGLIVPITEWVLQQSCQQLSIWQHQLGDKTTSISVNLCASYLTQSDMPDQILAAIQAANISPTTLHLEITESQIVGNADICMTNINRLREASVEVYIDDFGTGYSSLNYLASFRVNTLKIDKSFLENLQEGGKGEHIVRAITSLSHHLGMTVIAEGVENYTQMQLLKEIGCDFVQGFLLSKPVESRLATQMLGKKFALTDVDQRNQMQG
ncbi:MAG: GGDEF domain-containing protein [Gammaproteobacteria bacterium]|nr:GGDEF domain-containing protein [Gammaproteobacteria bacterium]